MRSVKESGDLRGKKVLLRMPLNVPVRDGKVFDDYRLVRALPTVEYLLKGGAEVTVIGHIGRKSTESLQPVIQELHKHIPNLNVLENLRQDPREVEDSEEFARELSQGHDLFVQDAFSVCHRKHTSSVSVPKLLPSYAGLLLEQEVSELSRALKPTHPSLFILGGAKFETKEPLIQKFLDLYDKVFVGGALANDFFKVRGFEVGPSLVSDVLPNVDLLTHPNLVLPEQVVVQDAEGTINTRLATEVQKDEKIVDVFMSSPFLRDRTEAFKTIVWNGPMGVYEESFVDGTWQIARALSGAYGAQTIVGGGDTLATIRELELQDNFSFISTGGGAMLKFLLYGTLPGIEALRQAQGKL